MTMNAFGGVGLFLCGAPVNAVLDFVLRLYVTAKIGAVDLARAVGRRRSGAAGYIAYVCFPQISGLAQIGETAT